jgi:hypothetical protein
MFMCFVKYSSVIGLIYTKKIVLLYLAQGLIAEA